MLSGLLENFFFDSCDKVAKHFMCLGKSAGFLCKLMLPPEIMILSISLLVVTSTTNKLKILCIVHPTINVCTCPKKLKQLQGS